MRARALRAKQQSGNHIIILKRLQLQSHAIRCFRPRNWWHLKCVRLWWICLIRCRKQWQNYLKSKATQTYFISLKHWNWKNLEGWINECTNFPATPYGSAVTATFVQDIILFLGEHAVDAKNICTLLIIDNQNGDLDWHEWDMLTRAESCVM